MKKPRPRAKKAPRKYSGYMTFPLTGASTAHEFLETTKYYGDFLDRFDRVKIFSRERLYRIEIHMKARGLDTWDVVDATVDRKLDKNQLAQVIKHIAMEQLKTIDGGFRAVDLHKSFIKVIVQ